MAEEEHGERGRCCRLPWVCASLPVSSRPEICLTWRRAEISDKVRTENLGALEMAEEQNDGRPRVPSCHLSKTQPYKVTWGLPVKIGPSHSSSPA